MTFEEIQEQMTAQNEELAELAELVERLPADVQVPRAALREIEEATEPAPPEPMPTIMLFALRG